MHELLKKLLEANILTEETKKEIEAAVTAKINEATEIAKEAARVEVTAELNEQWISERETLVEALDTKMTEGLAAELEEMRESIESFRDLEAEMAEKLVEARAEMAVALKADIATLVEKLNSFMEIRLAAELEEFSEDLEQVKRNEFGKKVYEAFATTYQQFHASDDSLEGRLNESEQRLADTLEALEASEAKASKLNRSIKLEKVLAPLTGRTKEVMEAILKNVDTPQLESAYSTYIGRVLKETSQKEASTSEKENTVLAEGDKGNKEVKGTIKDGNNKDLLKEETQSMANDDKKSTLSESVVARYRRLGGIQS